MISIAEVFKAELLGRLEAAPLSAYGPVQPSRIRRSHLTVVPRDEAPAIYVRFAEAKVESDKNCNWSWALEWTVSIYLRSDSDEEADPLVIEVLNRVNPATLYSNKVTVQIKSIESDPEIADSDAQRVDVKGVAKYVTPAWSLEARP